MTSKRPGNDGNSKERKFDWALALDRSFLEDYACLVREITGADHVVLTSAHGTEDTVIGATNHSFYSTLKPGWSKNRSENIAYFTEIKDVESFLELAPAPETRITYCLAGELFDAEQDQKGTLLLLYYKPTDLAPEKASALQILRKQLLKEVEDSLDGQIRAKTDYYRDFLDHVHDYIFELDNHGRFIYCNQTMIEDAGIAKNELLGSHFSILLNPDQVHVVLRHFVGLIQAGTEASYLDLQIQTSFASSLMKIGLSLSIEYQGKKFKRIRGIARNKSEITLLQNELEEKEELYKLITENSQELILLLDENGKLLYFSPSSENILGMSAEELNNKKLVDLVHPEDIKQIENAVEQLEEVQSLEYRIYHAERQAYLWVESSFSTIRTENKSQKYIRSTTRNIDQRKNQEALIQQQKTELEAFITFTPDAVAMINNDLEFLLVTDSWKILHGEPGSHYLPGPGMVRGWDNIWQRCMKGTHVSGIEENTEGKWIRWEIKPWYKNDQRPAGAIILNEDITDAIKRNKQLEEAKKKAEAATVAKANFLSTMSHEIRTPLNAVISLSHVLLQDAPLAHQMENLELIQFSSEELLSLINDILDYNKIESGKIELENKAFSLANLISKIKGAQNYKAQEKQIELSANIDESVPEFVIGDPLRLAQIINNLVANAIKFTEEGKVEINIFKLSDTDSEVQLIFEVADTGIGISKENHEKIFESFSQAETSTTRLYGGTGLGLSITKHLLKVMGSEIEVRSRPGHGSTFAFSLRLNIADHDETFNSESFTNHENSLFGSLLEYDLRILLAEDNITNQIVARKFIDKWGVSIDMVENGKDAVEMVQKTEYDLILMDLQMPVMDGYEAARQIRSMEDEYAQKVPIIALTAASLEDALEKTKNYGMNDFLSKPFIPSDLYRKIVHYGLRDKSANEKTWDPYSREIARIQKNLLEYFQEDPEFTEQIIPLMITNLQEFSEDITLAVKEGDSKKARGFVHKSKSTLSIFKVNALLKELEYIAYHPTEPEVIQNRLSKALETLDRVIGQLQDMKNKFQPDPDKN